MPKQFIQATCTKSNGDFILCSNLGFMDDPTAGITFAQAEAMVLEVAAQAEIDGYSVVWTREPLGEWETKWYSAVA